MDFKHLNRIKPYSNKEQKNILLLYHLYRADNKNLWDLFDWEFFETMMFVDKIFRFLIDDRKYIPFTYDYKELDLFEDG